MTRPLRTLPTPHRCENRDEFMRRWRMVASADERRACPRVPTRATLFIAAPDGQTVLRCRSVNHSRTGLYALVPSGVELGVGERVEARLVTRADGPDPARCDMRSIPATIVRAERVFDEDGDRLGVAVSFDSPLQLDAAASH